MSLGVVLVATTLVTGAATVTTDDIGEAAAAIENDPRYDAEVDDLVYGEPDEVIENYTAYVESLETVDPELWAGGYVDGDELVIGFVGQSHGSAASAIAHVGIRKAVRLEARTVSVADFDEAIASVSALEGLDGLVSAVGPDYKNGRLIVEFMAPDAYTVSAAHLQAGAVTGDPTAAIDAPSLADLDVIDGAITVPFAATVTTTVPASTSRYYDSSPYKGGAAIKMRYSSSVWSLCSSGFAWTPPSGTTGQYLLTASHCAMNGDGVAKSVVHRFLSDGTTSKIGDVIYRSGNGNGTVSGRKGDVAVIKLSTGTSSPQVYTGTYNTTTTKVSGTAVVLPAGWTRSSYSALYNSGASGMAENGPGQIDPDRVTKTNYTMTYLDSSLNLARNQKFTNLTVAEHSSKCFAKGDSGGAVYILDQSGLRPVGIVSGNNLGGAGLTNCWNFYSPLSAVSTEWGGAVKTG